MLKRNAARARRTDRLEVEGVSFRFIMHPLPRKQAEDLAFTLLAGAALENEHEPLKKAQTALAMGTADGQAPEFRAELRAALDGAPAKAEEVYDTFLQSFVVEGELPREPSAKAVLCFAILRHVARAGPPARFVAAST